MSLIFDRRGVNFAAPELSICPRARPDRQHVGADRAAYVRDSWPQRPIWPHPM